MPEWLFRALNALVPKSLSDWLTVRVIDGPPLPLNRWLGHWYLAFGLGRYPRKMRRPPDE